MYTVYTLTRTWLMGNCKKLSLSFLHIFCRYASNHAPCSPSIPRNVVRSERRVIQFPLCIIGNICRYQNASQAYYKSSHCFVLKNSFISIWTSKHGCIQSGLSGTRVWGRGISAAALPEETIYTLFFSQFNTLLQLTRAQRRMTWKLMGCSFIFHPLDSLRPLSETNCGPPVWW